VNTRIEWMGALQPTQAEVISTCLIIAGAILLFRTSKKNATLASK